MGSNLNVLFSFCSIPFTISLQCLPLMVQSSVPPFESASLVSHLSNSMWQLYCCASSEYLTQDTACFYLFFCNPAMGMRTTLGCLLEDEKPHRSHPSIVISQPLHCFTTVSTAEIDQAQARVAEPPRLLADSREMMNSCYFKSQWLT